MLEREAYLGQHITLCSECHHEGYTGAVFRICQDPKSFLSEGESQRNLVVSP